MFPITLTSKEFTRIMAYKQKLDAATEQIAGLRAENKQLRSENRKLRSRAAAAEKKARTYAGIIRETTARKR